ncbi:MAG: toll/interleukin-1 receptor domain-containing protein [Hyphomonadaceae bacterium]|nr:toll/interleukin-1 receptor domain-containing protein [Hyphomonadaceae bacterium]
MTVFIAFAPADRSAAESLEAVIERRGQFAELDDGQTALRPVMAGDAFILLVSNALSLATARLRLEQRALDAWASGRLILVRLDKGIAPVGLRDLPSVDATFEAQKEFVWLKVAEEAREKQKLRASSEDNHVPTARPNGGGMGRFLWLGLALTAVPGVLAAAAAVAIYLANRIGPVPGGWRELVAGVDALGQRMGAPTGAAPWMFGLTIAVTLAILAFGLVSVALRLRRVLARPRSASPQPASGAIFISYARANESLVLPIIEGAQQAGRTFWVDQQGGVSAGDSWAGEIVRAIRNAASVVVMCSRAAFESDHVKREIYLADRYQKKLTPVYVEEAEPPEDFEYFFAGLQPLKLFETPEADRPQALVRVLG